MLPWFSDDDFPLYLAPMAGVTDVIFRQICKEMGADVMVTEFVSAEGIMQADERTRKYTEFTEAQRPVGVQLFGADGERMGEAARKIIDWKRPDFIDINFGCPVNKVVVEKRRLVAAEGLPGAGERWRPGVAKAVGDQVPVTAKIRIGWDEKSVNAVEVARILEDCGMQAIAVHGRTRSQGYGGEADWEVIDAVARAVSVPVIGNGDIAMRRGRGAAQARDGGVRRDDRPRGDAESVGFPRGEAFPRNGRTESPVIDLEERWELVLRHCRMAVASGRYGNERQTLTAMRSRLMAYCKGFPGAKELRQRLCHVASVAEVEDLAAMSVEQREAQLVGWHGHEPDRRACDRRALHVARSAAHVSRMRAFAAGFASAGGLVAAGGRRARAGIGGDSLQLRGPGIPQAGGVLPGGARHSGGKPDRAGNAEDARTFPARNTTTPIAGPLRKEFDRRGWWKRGKDAAGVTAAGRQQDPRAGDGARRAAAHQADSETRARPGGETRGSAAKSHSPAMTRRRWTPNSRCSAWRACRWRECCRTSSIKSEKSIAGPDLPFLVLTARIDAPTYATCERMIRDAIETEKTGLWGMAYVDIANKFPQGDKWLETVVARMRRRASRRWWTASTTRFRKTIR